MTTFLLPDEPITTLDAYLATDTGGLGVKRAQELGPQATVEAVATPGCEGAAAADFPPAASGRASHPRLGPRPNAGSHVPSNAKFYLLFTLLLSTVRES